MRRCVGCAKKVEDSTCRCGVNQHEPRCPECLTHYNRRAKQTYVDEAAQSIYEDIDKRILSEFGIKGAGG